MPSSSESPRSARSDVVTHTEWVVVQQSNASSIEDQHRLRVVLAAVRAGIWEIDFGSGLLKWSPEMYDLHGFDRNSGPLQAGVFFSRLVHAEDRASVQSAILTIAAGGEPGRKLDIEYRAARPDGTTVWISALGSIEQDQSGRPIRAMGIARDVSARKRVELAQRDADRFIQQIADVAPSLIYVFDIETGTRIYGNRWLPDVLGYEVSADTQVNEFMDRILHPDDRQLLADYRRSHAHLPDDVVSEVEYRARHADGSWHWFLSRNLAFVRNADGSVRQVIGTATDITAVKHAEEELRRLNAELERRVSARTADLTAANRELEAFADCVSHDLRGPLRAIGGFSRAVLDNCGEQLDTSGRRYLSHVTDAVQRMAEMIEGLLALSRTTRHELSLRAVDLSALARTALADLRHADPDRRVEIVIAPHAPATGDTRLLRVALDNLLGNAWKFTSRRELARIEFGIQLEQGEPIYFVRDNGAGFDMAKAAALFVPFQRLHSAEEFEGTGIGLATVQRIVSRHGGRIWAQSAPDQGATFYFTLPNSSAGDSSSR